ncbi:MAG: aminotransferase class I/II-fold pyridoxal phosphate-dependent enzyme [Patescibacteria group bacterium]
MRKKIKSAEKLRVPYALSVHGREEERAVAAVIREHRTNTGREVSAFEKDIAKVFAKKYGVMVNSGSSANLLAIEILNLPPGSEVITPALTFNTTVAPLLQKGLVPVFVDVKLGTYLIDVDAIEKHITKKTRALMIPLLIGNIPDMARLRAIANKHKLFFIEDSCDTLGATFRGKPTGTWSDISTTSFFGSHIINAAGGGGMIMVNDQKWYRQLLVLRGWGRSSSLFAESEDMSIRFASNLEGIPYDGKFIFTEVGYNFLPLEISAAFGRVQLSKLGKFTKTRQKNFATLTTFFSKYKDIFDLPIQNKEVRTNWLAYPLMIRDSAPFERLELVQFLEQNNIQTRPVFTGNILRQPVISRASINVAGDYVAINHETHRQVVTKLASSLKTVSHPNTDQIMRRAFLIGCHHGIESVHIKRIQSAFEEFLSSHGIQKTNRI